MTLTLGVSTGLVCGFGLWAQACSSDVSSLRTDDAGGSSGATAQAGTGTGPGGVTASGGASGDAGSFATGGDAGTATGGAASAAAGSGGSSSAGASAGGSSAGVAVGVCGGDPVGPACEMTVAPTAPMIDSAEGDSPHGDTDSGIPGHWWCAGDGTPGATTTAQWKQSGGAGYYNVVLSPPRGDSLRAMYFNGTGFDTWGVAMGMAVNSCVDASAYTGIKFWVKSNTASGFTATFHVGTYETEPAREGLFGGGCTSGCDGIYQTLVDITTEWQEVTVPFCSLIASGAATALPFAKSKISQIGWIVPPSTDFDFYIDDVTFY